MNQQNSKQLLLSSLWERKDKNGNSYFTGSLNGLAIKVFKNKNPKNEKSPTHFMYVDEKVKRENQDQSNSSSDPFFNYEDGDIIF
jgi:hypothetical protein